MITLGINQEVLHNVLWRNVLKIIRRSASTYILLIEIQFNGYNVGDLCQNNIHQKKDVLATIQTKHIVEDMFRSQFGIFRCMPFPGT